MTQNAQRGFWLKANQNNMKKQSKEEFNAIITVMYFVLYLNAQINTSKTAKRIFIAYANYYLKQIK